MLLMLLIFLFVVLFSILPKYSHLVAGLIGKKVFRLSNEELDLRSQVRDLKSDQESVNMADEFARYMKIQRKIDKIMGQLKQLGSSRSQRLTMLKVGIKMAIHVVHALTMLSLVLTYRNEPLLELPSSYFFPFSRIVAFPTGIPGGVGIACWVLVCSTVVFRARRLIGV
ncbi:guided entry of tail-anchored proteins factor 1-like [Haliotis rubra]|uniref:guided entry of tail-anchored proteins factor 1-like n=1 Tax=Haliotis rubra TaxID=36100 RepID=UPI001EE5E290|nr:guided entry of tail-anchored proteins factor 1-like [Haliotis rubra]